LGRTIGSKKKMDITPRERIKGMLRQIFLKSNERTAVLKRDNYTCVKCGLKQSKKKGHEVKVQVHHKKGLDCWDHLIHIIYKQLLCDIEDLETLCVECHKNKHNSEL